MNIICGRGGEAGTGEKFADFARRLAAAILSIRQANGSPPIPMSGLLLERLIASPWPKSKEFFVVEEGGEIIATLGANVSEAEPQRGYLGFFEIRGDRQEVFPQLLQMGKRFLREQGVVEIYAPVNYSTWFSYRLRLPCPDTKYFSWEPGNPPFYPDLFQNHGFAVASLYHTIGVPSLREFAGAFAPSLAKISAAGYRLRGFGDLGGGGDLTRLLPSLYHLSMNGFSDNFLFEELSFEMFQSIYVPIMSKGDTSMSCVAVNGEDKPVGFCFAFAEGDIFIVKTIAVLPEARSQGLSNAMVHWGATRGLAQGLRRAAVALVRSGIQSESYTSKQKHEWKHEYVLYKITLSGEF
ncbi:MAG: hypothetical protein C5B49_04705 [Bdellovibrio sp.]|nr:MAG: hypothetical protein C5B49_04705 [Bdellovibrio sp.]